MPIYMNRVQVVLSIILSVCGGGLMAGALPMEEEANPAGQITHQRFVYPADEDGPIAPARSRPASESAQMDGAYTTPLVSLDPDPGEPLPEGSQVP